MNAAGTVFAGTDGGVVRSLDDGDIWEPINTGLENIIIESLAVSRDDVLFAGTDNGIYRTMDDGASWEAVHDAAIAGKPVRALTTNDSFALFAGTHGGGVFRSLDHGANWEAVNDGLAHLDVHALATGLDGSLFAGTHGGGIYRRDASTDVAGEDETTLPTEYQLAGNYPNPFNPTTRIRYALPRPEAVELTVYDATGRILAVLVDAAQPAGWHEVAFDASRLPSGVYFYRLKAGAFDEVRQMVLLR